MFTYTCILLLGTSLALHSHYEHLDLEYVGKEARRLTYLAEDLMFNKIQNTKTTLKGLIGKHDNMKLNLGESSGQEKWKKEFESEYCDDFDRALIAQKVCNELWKDSEKCNVGLEWGHAYETRDPDLVKEFLAEVDEKIDETLMYVQLEKDKRGDDL